MPPALVSVVYPNTPDINFDLEYYKSEHISLVADKWTKYGLKQYWVADLRASGGPYAIQTTMLWDSLEGFQKAAGAEESAAVFADVANFTNSKPAILSGPIVKSSL